MKQPTSCYLTHDFVVYKGLTLKELLLTGVVGLGAFCFLMTVLGFFLGYPGVCAALGLILGFIFSVRVLPQRLSNLKQNKPYGYLRKSMMIKAASIGLIQSPYLTYCGLWRTARLLRGE